jgi:hypothetical protein
MEMKWGVTALIFGALCTAQAEPVAELQLLAAREPQHVFAGSVQNINLCWRNPGNFAIRTDIHMRIVQLTSATAAPIKDAPWKRLQVLPGQTVLETAALEFPAVRAETRFLVQWLDRGNNVLGATEVLAYPANLLNELRSLLGPENGALGVFDPEDELKPPLKIAGIAFVDLENMELENFRGKLAIVLPGESSSQMDCAFAAKIKTIAQHGVAVVWVQPAFVKRTGSANEKIQPSFYSVPENQTVAVIVQPEMVADFGKNPRSQLNLIEFCKLALHPQPLTLPSGKTQP